MSSISSVNKSENETKTKSNRRPLEVISNATKQILTEVEESKSELKLAMKRQVSPSQLNSEGNSKILKLSDFRPTRVEENKQDLEERR